MPSGESPNSRKNLGKPFSSEYQPKSRGNNGRKPSKLKKYTKDNNVSINDIQYMVKYILPLTQKEMKERLLDDNVPIIIKVFIKALLGDLKNGNVSNIMKLLDRGFGTPKASVDLSTKIKDSNKNIDYSKLNPEDAKKLFFEKLNGDGDE